MRAESTSSRKAHEQSAIRTVPKQHADGQWAKKAEQARDARRQGQELRKGKRTGFGPRSESRWGG